jgi:hypothetical protein
VSLTYPLMASIRPRHLVLVVAPKGWNIERHLCEANRGRCGAVRVSSTVQSLNSPVL